MIKINSAEILCVGTELLMGEIVNTNAAYISGRLASMGINQYYQAVVGDNPARLERCITASLERCDLLIMTGGLGPTYDDLTKETAARLMNRRLYLHEPSLERMKIYFSERNVVMSETNIKQAMMPEGAVVFVNNNGTAPGLAVEDDKRGKIIIMLPGPPGEMVPMFRDSVEPYLKSFSSVTLVSRNINITGLGESAVEEILEPVMKAAINPTVAPYCKEGEVRLRVTARAENEDEGLVLCDEMIGRIRQTAVAPYIYGVDTDLPSALIDLLRRKGKKIATAESCTGGLIAETLTSVSGASGVFDGGVVSYANTQKISLLGVKKETLERFGAVSEETAREMAEGARALMDADIAVAVTGIAGPGGGTGEKPVGLVYIAVGTKADTQVRRCMFIGNRGRVRRLAAVTALSMAIAKAKSDF
ncbi:MAG: competence/damage-inducible protein A [Eubacteriales bacterium]|nr:competence/damage-inducible protein A [Eubacteriales bacterium]